MTQTWLQPAADLPDIAAPGVLIWSGVPSQHHDGCHALMTAGSVLVWRYAEQIPKLLLACSGLLVSQAWRRLGSLLPSAYTTNLVHSRKGDDHLFQRRRIVWTTAHDLSVGHGTAWATEQLPDLGWHKLGCFHHLIT